MKKTSTVLLALVTALILLLGSVSAGAQERRFAFVPGNFDNEIFANMLETFEICGERDGITVVGAEHQADTATMLSVGENLIASGVDCIMFQNFDPHGTEEIIAEWESQGVRVISYDEYSETATVNIQSANFDVGYQIGAMAAKWINANLADQQTVDVYIHGHFYDYLSQRADGIEAALAELAPNAVIVDRQDVMGSEEPNAFENSLIANPNIQVVCTINDTSCVNIVEWWISELKAEGADLSKYAGFSVDAVDTALQLIDKSKDNESLFRGTLNAQLGGVMDVTTQLIWGTVMDIYNGEPVEDWYYKFVEVTEDNVSEFLR